MKKAGVFLILVFLFASCATRKSIEYRDRVVTEYQTREVHDTLREKTTDSVYLEVKTFNDTVYVTKYKERFRWRDKIVIKIDTIVKDSIVVQEKAVVIERKTKPNWLVYGFFLIASILGLMLLNKRR